MVREADFKEITGLVQNSAEKSVRPILLIVGTRPEGIKMAPLYWALKKVGLPVKLCCTMQHGEILLQVLALFGLTPDYNLDIMRPGQDLFYLTQAVLQKTKELFIKERPSIVVVQGDTTSAFIGALSAFYLQIPVMHIEAGLRTEDLYAPYPEEMNRRAITVLAQYHCAPTEQAVENLKRSGVLADSIFCVGNTVVDALRIMQEQISSGKIIISPKLRALISEISCPDKQRKLVLLTVHRRESFDGGIERILATVKQLLLEDSALFCVYPYHPNPQVLSAIESVGLDQLPNCFLCEPLVYSDLVYLLSHAYLVMTDSGGIQEEAISLGKPLLVLREKTERTEGVCAGVAHLVGADSEKILSAARQLISKGTTNEWQERARTLYGDGHAAEKITAILQDRISGVQYFTEVIAMPKKTDLVQKKGAVVKKVVVVGLGYIGLPTALVSAEHGFEVVGVDVDSRRVERINAGDQVISEPEVYEKLQLALQSDSFRAQTEPDSGDYIVVAVPTPCTEKRADLSYVFSATEAIVSVIKPGATVILESTVPVGTTKKIADLLAIKTGFSVGRDFFIAHCPERVLPGKIFHELIENDRVIGGITPACARKAREFYEQFVQGKLYTTSAEAAEMVKLVENSSRDVQIAFANQVGSMATAQGLDPFEIIELANKHPRVDILKPSCGVGGHCIAVDPWFLIETYPAQTALLQAARTVNDQKPEQVISSVCAVVDACKKKQQGRCVVAIMGLTYKADVDDLRESPAYFIAQQLQKKDIEILVCEPYIKRDVLEPVFGTALVTATDAVDCADIILFLVPHTRFKALDKKTLQNKQVIDACGLLYKSRFVTGEKEPFFWPARGVLDFYIVNQDDERERLDDKDIRQEDCS